MRGAFEDQGSMFSYVRPGQRIPADHLRPISMTSGLIFLGRFQRDYFTGARLACLPCSITLDTLV